MAAYALPWKYLEEDPLEITIDLLFVKRKGAPKKTLAVDTGISCSCPSRRLMNTVTLTNEFDWQFGARAELCYAFNEEQFIDAAVSWVNPWEGDKTVDAEGTLKYPFDNPAYTQDYFDADEAKGRYTSHIWDAEACYWRQYTPRGVDYFSVSLLIGARGFYLGEHLKVKYYNPPDVSSYWSMTKNRMLGIQGGFNLQVNPLEHWSWEVLIKAGALGNWVWGKNWLGDVNNTVALRSHTASKVTATYFLDATAKLYYHFRSWCSTHLSYSRLGLWNIALAPGQFHNGAYPQAGAGVVADDKAYYQTIAIGFDYNF